MRVAELVMAIALAVFSLYLMWKSAELPIGWHPQTGPGGGAFWSGAACDKRTFLVLMEDAPNLRRPARGSPMSLESRSQGVALLGQSHDPFPVKGSRQLAGRVSAGRSDGGKHPSHDAARP